METIRVMVDVAAQRATAVVAATGEELGTVEEFAIDLRRTGLRIGGRWHWFRRDAVTFVLMNQEAA
nr:MAG: hypothetical protein DIU58_05110 [Sphaerobacter thermophilus]